MLEGILEFFDRVGLEPIVFLAIIIGLCLSWSATQFFKTLFMMQRWTVRALAFSLAFLSSFFIMPGYWPEPFWIALLIGLASPTAYKILVAFASSRWQWVRDLSKERVL